MDKAIKFYRVRRESDGKFLVNYWSNIFTRKGTFYRVKSGAEYAKSQSEYRNKGKTLLKVISYTLVEDKDIEKMPISKSDDVDYIKIE